MIALLHKARLSRDFHNWLVDEGANYALTLALGLHPTATFDPEREFKPELKKLFKHVLKDVYGIPKRDLDNLAPGRIPFGALVYEHRNEHGSVFPHCHGGIALHLSNKPDEPDEPDEPWLRATLRDRWGADADEGKDASFRKDWFSEPVVSSPRTARPVVRRVEATPSFCLRPIEDRGWANYALKYAGTEPTIWTIGEILL